MSAAKPNIEINAKKISLTEYEMYLNTAEKVTDRRLSILQTNSSHCLLMLAGIGVMVAWGYAQPEASHLVLFAVFVTSLLGAIYSKWFLDQIVSYKKLNSAKFEVLNKMSQKMEIQNIRKCDDCYFDPFELEWAILESRKQISKFGLKSSLSELTVPKGFLALFLLISFSAIVFLGMSFCGISWLK